MRLTLACRLFLVVVLLSGCATLYPVSQSIDARAVWEQHMQWLKGLHDWQATGRVAVRGASDGGTASMHWKQSPAHFSIRLYGPFGHGAIQIKGDQKKVSLHRPDGEVTRAGNAEELLLTELGWTVPVSVLRYWILGRPAPDYPVEAFRLNGAGLLGRLSQAGWQVTYSGYREAGQGMLPAKFELRRDSLRVRVVLSQWRLPE